ncbi:hybrid sensor histidine kinase/response regulator [Ideonella sp.]|uniref:hybrid sensor histidine kinase/response regulator n=1 Tax=Ideonella sp. TaxID=1929293 RepID=UPI002B48FF13|nr:response regulator [Ideonella sp.]HJV71337.1 response regulator [Ideonella sp.]
MALPEPAADAVATDRVNILVVDDLPEKLLVFRTVLEDLQQNMVFVRSGTEALREVLAREFAVILLDVNMPDIDGFETAALIRRHRRSAHTPIIFITSYADELQTARGYSLGAVDYILSPVVPEVLRSKVRVFVELHVLQKRIARQADERVALAASAAALQVAEEANRRSATLSELSHALSGLLDVHTGLHTLLENTVPALCGAASAVLLDEHLRVGRVVQRRDAAARTVDLAPDDLAGDELAALASLAPLAEPVPVPATVRAYPLRHGDRLLGALLVRGQPTALGDVLLDEVAARAAVAFAAAQLHQSLQVEIAERRQAEARLEDASRRKDEFIAMLSHELRSPLAPIRNAVEVIRRLAPRDATLQWATDITDRQVRQLTRLVDELLDVARISQGKIVLQRTALDLCASMAEWVETQRPFITSRRQTLTQALPPQPVWVHADAARIQQVVSNLLSNAIKYTPDEGSLHVAVTADDGQAVISVRDNGMGIEPDLLPRVFDLFEQGHRTLDRSQGGLGIGLTLVQLLVKLHSGRVEALSAGSGQGAEFRVYLPLQPQAADSPHAAEPVPASPVVRRRILVVDDNVDVADTTAAILGLSGHTLCTAHDGAEALAQAEAFQPEVVLLDIGLPVMDGYEVARRLRELPATREVLLIALTGYGQSADRQRGREAGFDEHLLKPIDPTVLDELIARGRAAPGATLYAFRRPGGQGGR